MTVLAESALPLPLVRRGKVREVYAVDDERLLLVASDRVSAFDIVMREPIPSKGAVLTQLSAFWFERLAPVVPSHFVTARTDEILERIPALRNYRDQVAGRAMLVRRTVPVPFECVVRGYLSGSAWVEYRASGTLAGEPLPAALIESARLEPPIFSPATKAESGHDLNVTTVGGRDRSRRRADRAAPRGELRRLSRGTRPRRVPRDHHRGYQVRVRDRSGRHAAADRRGHDPGFVPVLAGGPLPAGTEPAELRQAAAARLSRRAADGRELERRGAPADPSGRCRRGDQPPVSRGVPAHHWPGAGAARLMRTAPEGRWFIAGAWLIALALVVAAVRAGTAGWWVAAAVWLALSVWVVAFFRDPDARGCPRAGSTSSPRPTARW